MDRSERAAIAVVVGANLRRWRRRRGLSQTKLATIVGHDRTAVCRWEAGNRLPALLALARVLGCEPAALFDGLRTEHRGPDGPEAAPDMD